MILLVRSGPEGSQFTRFDRTIVGWSNVKEADVLGFSQKKTAFLSGISFHFRPFLFRYSFSGLYIFPKF